jgi:tetratricopeptide (TPR) repeat protein
MSDDDRLTTARVMFVAGALDEASELVRARFAEAKSAGDRLAMARARMLSAEIAYDRLRYVDALEGMRRAADELSGERGAAEDEARYVEASLALVRWCLDDIDGAKAALVHFERAEALPDAGSVMSVMRAAAWMTMAVVHASLGGGSRAREILERLLDVVPETDDLNVALRATTHLHLAVTLEHANAEEHLRKCIELRTRLWGPENARVIAAKFDLARLFLAQNRTDGASSLTRDLLVLMKTIGIEREPRMSTAYATAGLAELMSGDVGAGTILLEMASALEEKTFGTTDPNTAHMLAMLAQVHATRRNWGKVVGLARRILPALAESARWAGTYATIAGLDCSALTALGRSAEGATHLRDALVRLEKRRPSLLLREPEAKDLELRIAELWLMLGRTEIAIDRERSGIQAIERARTIARERSFAEVLAAADGDLAHLRRGGGIGLKGSA